MNNDNLKIFTQKPDAEKSKAWMKKHPIFTGIGIVIFLIFIISLFSGGSKTKETNEVAVNKVPSDVEICVESEHLIERFLKAPSTAKFPTCNEIPIEKLDNGGFKVSSYVDSQNTFGAMIRSNWVLSYHYTDNYTRTQMDQVIIDGKTVFDKNSK